MLEPCRCCEQVAWCENGDSGYATNDLRNGVELTPPHGKHRQLSYARLSFCMHAMHARVVLDESCRNVRATDGIRWTSLD